MPSTAPLSDEMRARCRNFRRQPTEAERKLWAFLRNRRLDGIKFRRQHPLDPFILDFFCQEARLCIEIDGSEHLEPEQEHYDVERTRFLQEHGIRVIRFSNHDILAHIDLVLDVILTEVRSAIPK